MAKNDFSEINVSYSAKRMLLFLILGCFLPLSSIQLAGCKSKENIRSPMGWVSHKKVKRYDKRQNKRNRKENKRKKNETPLNKIDTQKWFRNWLKGDKKKSEK